MSLRAFRHDFNVSLVVRFSGHEGGRIRRGIGQHLKGLAFRLLRGISALWFSSVHGCEEEGGWRVHRKKYQLTLSGTLTEHALRMLTLCSNLPPTEP